MRHRTLRCLVIGVMLLPPAISSPADPDAPEPNLTPLTGFVGQKWTGRFMDAEESMELYMTWEPILNGTALQMRSWNSDSDMKRMNIYYWDAGKQAIGFLAMTSNGYINTGTITSEGPYLLFDGRQVNPAGEVIDTCGRWELRPDGTIHATGCTIENGALLPAGHTILWERD